MMYPWRHRKGGLLPEEVATLFVAQGERCYICQRRKSQLRAVSKEQWNIDHDKGSPPRIRGILCSTCNLWLGKQEDLDPGKLKEVLRRAADYVNAPPAQRAGVNREVTFDSDRPRVELSANELSKAQHFYSLGVSVPVIAKNAGCPATHHPKI